MLILPVVPAFVIRKQNAHIRTVIGSLGPGGAVLIERVHDTPCTGALVFFVVKIRQNHDQKCHIIVEGQAPRQPMPLVEGAAETTVPASVCLKFFYFQFRFIHQHIAEHCQNSFRFTSTPILNRKSTRCVCF